MTGVKKLKAHVQLPGGTIVQAVEREAETLLRISAGRRGITPLDAHRAGTAFRLAAYVHDLKALGILVEMEREPHPGGWHGRYRLAGDVAPIWSSDDLDRAAT